MRGFSPDIADGESRREPSLDVFDRSKSASCSSANVDARADPSPVNALFNKAAELRPVYAKAEADRDKATVDLLSIAFEIALTANKDETARAAVRSEAKRLGARPNKRSGIEHLVVDIGFPPGTISSSLRTRHAHAVRAGLTRGYTTDQFRRAAADGPSGKGGIKELAKIGRELASGLKTADGSAHAGTNASPDPQLSAHTGVVRRVSLQDEGLLYAVIVSEKVRQSLLASGLKTGDEFRLQVCVTAINGLEAVKYLGPCDVSGSSRAAGRRSVSTVKT